MKTLIFTVCTAEQYPFAKVLADSLPKNILFKTGITTGRVTDNEAVMLEELALPDDVPMRGYDAEALAAAGKPFFADYFLREEGADRVIYFDPTVWVTGDIELILKQLQTADIVLTPRLAGKFGQSLYGDEKLFLNTGMYDAGFWAIRKTENSFRFLKWWQARLTDRAHFDLCNGMNHEQLWLNYVPIFFDNVSVCKHIGWNVGLQNLHERVLTPKKEKWMVNHTEELLFFNFRECLTKSTSVNSILNRSGAAELRTQYVEKLKKYTDPIPSVFSLRRAMIPETPAWKHNLRQKIQDLIDSINDFPLYHKITK
ncbi:MAG: hypothetical protein U0X91_24645 [Spirosomataceae bacterium]